MRRWLIIAIALALTVSLPAGAQGIKELTTFKGHARQVVSLSFSVDGQTLASADEYGGINLWNITSGENLSTVHPTSNHRPVVPSLAFSVDGANLAIAEGVARVFDVATGRLKSTQTHQMDANEVAFSPDGRSLAVLGHNVMFPKGTPVVALFDLAARQVRTFFPEAERRWRWSGLRFSGDGRYLATGGKTVYIWDLNGRRPLALTQSEEVYNVAGFSSDGKMVALTRGNSVELWEVASRRLRAALHVEGRSELHNKDALGVSPDLRLVVSGDKDGNLTLWDLFKGRKLLTVRAHSDRLTAAAFSSDGRRLATGSFDRTVKVWDVSELQK